MIGISKSKLLTAAIIVIALANLVVWGYILLKKPGLSKTTGKKENSGMLANKSKLPDFNIKTHDGQTITPRYLDAGLNVLIFFSPGDCPACLFEAGWWAEAAKMFPEPEVIFLGFTPEKDRESIRAFSHEYGISFPILFDMDGDFQDRVLSLDEISRMNITTPFKVFIDRNGEIFYLEGPIKDPEEQKLFPARVSQRLADSRAGTINDN